MKKKISWMHTGKGIPYQTLISGMIHQYIEGDLVERKTG